ncbi:MAG: AAA family ATPase [Candidatus Woesebacteria bacterium]|jgi:hypothetical protein
MNIRRIEISNFRGIKESTWVIPDDRKFICLIGPGDSGKTALLDAIHYTLGDRWRLSISDTDFYNCDTANPICIRAVIADIPKELLKESAFGLHLSGIDDEGNLHQDPEDGLKACLIIQLKVDETHEPIWSVERVDGSDGVEIRSSQRHYLATFKVDERADVHLRWTSTSALGRLSHDKNSAVRAMASAARAASKAISEHEDAELAKLTDQVQAKINEAGGGSFSSIKPGLDTSLSSVGGNLALYEADIPLTNYGLGTRRISGLAVQQIAASNKSLLLVDEIETGLEPHRLVRLIHYLREDKAYSQVFITTHSPVAVEQALTENLAVVRSNDDGVTNVAFLPDGTGTALKLRRSRPSSFLANRILVVEGKTEEGLLLHSVTTWDKERIRTGLPVAAGEGSVIQDGQGGSDAPLRAIALSELGYDVAVFIDNDDSSVDEHVAAAQGLGINVIRWEKDNNTERQIIFSLEAQELNSFLLLAKSTRGDETTVLNDLHSAGLPVECTTLDVGDWSAHGVSTDDAKQYVAKAAAHKDRSWFKTVDGGKLLGGWIEENSPQFNSTVVREKLEEVKNFLYPTQEQAETEDVGE